MKFHGTYLALDGRTHFITIYERVEGRAAPFATVSNLSEFDAESLNGAINKQFKNGQSYKRENFVSFLAELGFLSDSTLG